MVLPLVTREVVSLVHAGDSVNETLDLSTYGFLYGTFPSAPTVFVFATQYNLDIDLVSHKDTCRCHSKLNITYIINTVFLLGNFISQNSVVTSICE